MRVDAYGEAAAGRLAELDKKRGEWRSRLSTYQAARNALVESYGGDFNSERVQEELLALRATHFQGLELKRVSLLDNSELK